MAGSREARFEELSIEIPINLFIYLTIEFDDGSFIKKRLIKFTGNSNACMH